MFYAQGIAASRCSIAPINPGNPDTPPDSISGHKTPIGVVVKSILPGQGNASPPFTFSSGHAVVQVGGSGANDTIYDPSYGYMAPNLMDWANHSLSGLRWTDGPFYESGTRDANAEDVRISADAD